MMGVVASATVISISGGVASAASVPLPDISTPALPTTPLDPLLGSLGLEDQPGGLGLAVDGLGDLDQMTVIGGAPAIVNAVQSGRVSLRAAQAGGFQLETCILSFRRRVDKQGGAFPYFASWGSRFACNVVMRRMDFRARLVFKGQDSRPIEYARRINKSNVRNEISAETTQFIFKPDLVVYVTGDLSFPRPTDPNNFAVGVIASPNSVNQDKSDCKRVGKTFTVECKARSIAFKPAG